MIAGDTAEFGSRKCDSGVLTGSWVPWLPGRVGWSNAMEMLADRSDDAPSRAQEMGLVWRVVPPDDVMAEARTLAARLVCGAPLAQRATKEMAARGPRLPWEDALRLGESMRRVVGATEDASEGMRAASERRIPEWRGR